MNWRWQSHSTRVVKGRADRSGKIAFAIRDKSQTNCSFAMKVFNVESGNG